MRYSQYFMQIKQLQALALQCRQILHIIQGNNLTSPSKTHSIEQTIRQRRKEVAELKQQIKDLRLQQKKQKQLNKNIRAAQKQLERMKAITAKEEAHYKQLNKLCQRLAQNMLDQKTKSAQLAEEENIMKKYQIYADEGLQMSNQYELLRERLNETTRQSLQMRGNWEQQWRGKKQWVKAIDTNNASIDEKIHFLSREIDVQHEIIEGIHQMERNHQEISKERPAQDDGYFSILQKQARVFFQKSTNLSVWEKHEVTNLLERKQLEKEKQARRIGSIFRQRFTEHRSHNSFINEKKPFYHSTDLNKTANQTTIQRYKPSPFHFVSNDRIKQLEMNKRIRTRYTEPAQPFSKSNTNHLKTVVQEEQPQKQSIVTIYERLKRQKQQGNTSVIKFKRLENKRKSLRKRRGVPIESEHF